MVKKFAVSLHDFHMTHKAFAPPQNDNTTTTTTTEGSTSSSNKNDNAHDDNKTNETINSAVDETPRKPRTIQSRIISNGEDISTQANEFYGGHGVFICSKCAEAHRELGPNITRVLPVIDITCWKIEEVEYMMISGGNARCWTVYEAYIPDAWRHRRPISSSSLSQRLLFCRAKYEALAFVLPPPGTLAETAWSALLQRSKLGQKYGQSSDLKNIISLSASRTVPSSHHGGTGVVLGGDTSKDDVSQLVLPQRLVNYFCVVCSSMQLSPKQLKTDLSTLQSIEELEFWPHVSDFYPEKDFHNDMEFPEHLPSFVMPKGCHPHTQPKPPSFFSFVLTMADGGRLYGGALEIFDEHYDLDDLRDAIEESGYDGELPGFLKNGYSPSYGVDEDDEKESNNTYNASADDVPDVVFFPRYLVFLSHYPFFDLFRNVLLEIYQISLTAAPLPIERYIANFVHEVPLPPQGNVRVEFAFTTEKKFTIERPPVNKLPMANFSFRPLFASLSVPNIVVVLSALLQEQKVVLLSQYFSILTPVAEALLSALFPFQWVGLYIVSCHVIFSLNVVSSLPTAHAFFPFIFLVT